MIAEPEISDEDLDRALRVLVGCDCSWCARISTMCFYDYAAECYGVVRRPFEEFETFQARFHDHRTMINAQIHIGGRGE